jgi:hypothetical protein
VVFFSIVFIYLNAEQRHASGDLKSAMPFLTCLMKNPTDPKDCYALGQALFVNQSTVIAVLMMLSVAGIQTFILLVRSAMFPAWIQLARSRFGKQREFVSLDAKQYTDVKTYELNKVTSPAIKSPQSAVTSPSASEFESWRRSVTNTPDHFSKEIQRDYSTPIFSFSTPRAPSRVEWDPRATHARGGLRLHPVDDDEDDITRHKI